MGAVVTYPGWGPFRLFPLSNGQCDDLNDALWVCKQGISSLHRIRVDYDHNLVTVDLDRRSGFKTEQSIIDYLFGCLKDYELEMSVVVAVRNRSCVPSIAFVGVNPSTNRWEYLKDIPRLIDDNTGRIPPAQPVNTNNKKQRLLILCFFPKARSLNSASPMSSREP